MNSENGWFETLTLQAGNLGVDGGMIWFVKRGDARLHIPFGQILVPWNGRAVANSRNAFRITQRAVWIDQEAGIAGQHRGGINHTREKPGHAGGANIPGDMTLQLGGSNAEIAH